MKQLAITIAVGTCGALAAPVLFGCIGIVAGVQFQRALIRSVVAYVRAK